MYYNINKLLTHAMFDFCKSLNTSVFFKGKNNHATLLSLEFV